MDPIAEVLFARTNVWKGRFSGVSIIGGAVGEIGDATVLPVLTKGEAAVVGFDGCVKLVKDLAFFNTSFTPADDLGACVLELGYTIPILLPVDVLLVSNSFLDFPPSPRESFAEGSLLTLRTITCGWAILLVTASSLLPLPWSSSSSLWMMVGLMFLTVVGVTILFNGDPMLSAAGGDRIGGVGVLLPVRLSDDFLLNAPCCANPSVETLIGGSKFTVARGAIDFTVVIIGEVLDVVVVVKGLDLSVPVVPGILRVVLGELVGAEEMLVLIWDDRGGCAFGDDDVEVDVADLGVCAFGSEDGIKFLIDDSMVGGSNGTFRGENGLDTPAEAKEEAAAAAAASWACSFSILSMVELVLLLLPVLLLFG